MPIIKIHNAETGEVIEREMTEAELEQHKKDEAEWAAIIAEREAKKSEKNQLLEKLGITEEEAKLLLS